MERVFYDKQPTNKEAVGNGNWLYRWDIKEEQVEREEGEGSITQYSCYEVTVNGPITYEKCVSAVIRASYSEEEELAMINKFNSYNNDIISDESIVEEYKAYLAYVAEVKAQVKSDLGVGFNL